MGEDAASRFYRVSLSPLVGGRGFRYGFLMVLLDVTDLTQMRQRLFEERLVPATLRECERVASKLHDTLSQQLACIHLQAQAARERLASGQTREVAALLGRLPDVARGAHADVRGLLKSLERVAFLAYLDGVMRGEAALSSAHAMALLNEFAQQGAGRGMPAAAPPAQPHARPDLTPCQREILELVAQGLTYKEIGAALNPSERTIKYHMGEIARTLRLKHREQVVAYALRTGLVRPPEDDLES